MFAGLEPKLWASHLAREQAEANAAGYPGAAIGNYRSVGMNECESVLDDSFAAAALEAKLAQIDHRQEQARRRIAINRRCSANIAAGNPDGFKTSRRTIAQRVHEDEGVIMGLERLWFIMSGTCPSHAYEAAIDGPVR